MYRLVRAARASDVLSGEGARLYGGRWNPRGLPVVYASESRALAVLESFVHVTKEARTLRFFLYEITLPRRAAIRGFDSAESPLVPESQATGRKWLEDGIELALRVPSVIVPQEMNYVLNTRHAQFSRLQVSNPESFSFDDRLWERRAPV